MKKLIFVTIASFALSGCMTECDDLTTQGISQGGKPLQVQGISQGGTPQGISQGGKPQGGNIISPLGISQGGKPSLAECSN